MIRRPRLSDIRNGIDRLLHARRRETALEELGSAAFPRSVLFVCYGNICRSPYAAGAFGAAIARRGWKVITVDSAGFVGPNRPTPEAGIDAAARRGVDLREHRSKLLTPRMIAQSDLIVVMEAVQRRWLRRRHGSTGAITILGDLDQGPIGTRTILDPWNQPEEAFSRSYVRIDRCLDELVQALARLSDAPSAPTASETGPASHPHPSTV